MAWEGLPPQQQQQPSSTPQLQQPGKKSAPQNTLHPHLLLPAPPRQGRTCSQLPLIMTRGQQLTWALLSPAMPCTTPGPDTVSSTPGVPVRKPAAAAA